MRPFMLLSPVLFVCLPSLHVTYFTIGDMNREMLFCEILVPVLLDLR